jgi:anaerobic magnesium-protoporphyrin IX monomethyl ester cyclase
MMPYPPLGTLYAASYLRSRGISIAFHDVMFSDSEAEIEPALDVNRPQIVVVYDDEFNYLTKMCLSRMREAAFELTRRSKKRGCTVIIFSSDASDHLEEYFAHGADYVICGEAEITLAALCENLLHRSQPSVDDIAGVAFFRNGRIHRTHRRPVLENLDVLPFPAWDLVDMNSYRTRWMRRHGYFSLNLVTTRGCPFHCNWCAKPIYGQVYHSRSPENVVEEMTWLKHTLHPDHIWFCDDIFGLKPGWVEMFDDVVNRSGAVIPFKCLSRADLLLRGDTICHLKRAGCVSVWIGAESGSQKILDAMEKGTTVEQIYTATRCLHEAGINVGFFLQFGYPSETKEDIEKTLRMVKDCRPDEIGVSVSYPLPGTKFYERVKEEMGEKHNWVDSQDLDLMFRGTFSRQYYRTLHRVVHKKFRVWRGQTMLRKMLSRSHPRFPSFQVAASMLYHGLTLPPHLLRLRFLEKTADPELA